MPKTDKYQLIVDYVDENAEWRGHEDLLASPPTSQEISEEFPDADSEMIRRAEESMTPWFTRGALYFRLRVTGLGDRAAAMYSLQKAARCDTDDVFFEGSRGLYDQFESQKALDRNLAAAKRHGFVPSKQAVYFPNLARFPGDPEAYVTRAQGRSHIKKVLEQRGWSCEGGINVAGRQPEDDPLDPKNCKPLGESIIRRRMKEMVQQDPGMSRRDRKELREKIVSKHGAK